jgi:hypothetical protein
MDRAFDEDVPDAPSGGKTIVENPITANKKKD